MKIIKYCDSPTMGFVKSVLYCRGSNIRTVSTFRSISDCGKRNRIRHNFAVAYRKVNRH